MKLRFAAMSLALVMMAVLLPVSGLSDGGYGQDLIVEVLPTTENNPSLVEPIVSPGTDTGIVSGMEAVVPAFSVDVGGTVVFGAYEQDGNAYNGKEPIEWQVLDVQGDRMLIISKACLSGQRYNEKYTKEIWSTCTVRTWLNSEFLYSAFSDAERQRIQPTWVDCSASQNNPAWNTAQTGGSTQDQIFLLSWKEVQQYLPNESSRICWMTAAAGTQRYSNPGDKAWWWLRSPGKSNLGVSIVRFNGSLSNQHINEPTGGIRPALWITMDVVSPIPMDTEIIY